MRACELSQQDFGHSMLDILPNNACTCNAWRLLASRVAVSFADSNCSKAGAQVAPNSVLAQSRVNSSRLLKACLAAAAAFASACSTAAATRSSFLLFRTCMRESLEPGNASICARGLCQVGSLTLLPKHRTCYGKSLLNLTLQKALRTV